MMDLQNGHMVDTHKADTRNAHRTRFGVRGHTADMWQTLGGHTAAKENPTVNGLEKNVAQCITSQHKNLDSRNLHTNTPGERSAAHLLTP